MTLIPNRDADVCGTSLQGYLNTTYAELVKRFGEPHERYGDKTEAEWFFDTPAGVATLYDYKNCMGAETETNWHIGGHSQDVLVHFREAFGEENVSNKLYVTWG